MTYGYARVSSISQNLDRQLLQLREYVIDDRFIICDKSSGKDFNRKGYNSLVGTDETAPILHENDLLVITSLDRLGRNYTEIKHQWEHLTQTLKVNVKVLDMPLLDTQSNSLDGKLISDLVLQILSYVSEKERISIKERQKAGIAIMPVDAEGRKISIKTGRPTGRPRTPYPDNWNNIYIEWKSGKITATKAMQLLNLKKTVFYKLVNQYQQNNL